MYANLYFCDIVAQKYIFSKTNVSFSLPRSTYTTISTRTVSASLAERRQTFCSQFKLRHVGILRKSPELSEMAPDSKKNRIQKKIVRCLKTSDQRRKIEGGGVSREEEDEPLVGKPNLQGVENTGAIPRTYHRSRLQPGSTLFNSCSPPVPFLPLFQRGTRPKRELFVPSSPILAYFHLFSLSSSPSPRTLCLDIESQTRKWPAGSSPPFWKMHAPVFVRIVRTPSTITHPHEPSFHSWLGKVFQKTLKMHDIRLVRKRGSTRIDNRVHNGQTLGYRWLGYTCTTRERWEFLGGGGGCTDVSRWIRIRNRRIFCFPFPR